MNQTIIYFRKSTDRDDKQANSLEHQLNNCRNTAELKNLVVYKEIGESKSAKTEFTRNGFNEMIKLCKSGKIDYILADEPKRLSRNNLDTSRIIDLLDKKQIKGVICTTREYHADNSRDKFLLQLDLSLSKMDNEDRAKDVKDKMITAFKRGQWVGKAPRGYLNVTIKKGLKDVIIDKEKGPLIKHAFSMRVQGYSYTKIGDYLFEQGIRTSTGKALMIEQVKRMLNNKFYMGTMQWAGLEAKGKHKPLISKDVFLQATEKNKKVVHTYKNRVYQLAGIIKGTDGKSFRGYTKKTHVYYCSARQSDMTINISEKLVFEKFANQLMKFDIPRELKPVTESMLKDIYRKVMDTEQIQVVQIKKELLKLQDKKSFLVDNFLEGNISKEIYNMKLREMDIREAGLEKKLKPVEQVSQKKLKILEKRAELFVTLYSSYPESSIHEKLNIVKLLGAELSVGIKKELQVAENQLMKLLRKLHNHIWYSQRELNSCPSLEKAMS